MTPRAIARGRRYRRLYGMGRTADPQQYLRLPILEESGYAVLEPLEYLPAPREWESLDYIDWESGGDTRFAILASVDGEHEPRYRHSGRPDKDAIWTPNAERSPELRRWVEECGAGFGRVRVIRQRQGTYEEIVSEHLHRDNNNDHNTEGEGWVVRAWLQLTDDPDSYMILRDARDDASTEAHIHLRAGTQFVIDSERLFHSVRHVGVEPRYALIASFESGPELERWIQERLPRSARA